MPLTPADVHNVAFSKPPIGKRGYNEDEVDAFLDLVENELTRLIEENSDLRQRVAELDQELASARAGGGNVQPTQTIPVYEPEPEPAPPPPQPVYEAPPAQAAQAAPATEDQHLRAAKMLGLAQDTADRLTGTAKAESDKMLADARAQADAMVTEARQTAETTVAEARQRADAMLADAQTRSETQLRQAQEKADALQADAERKHSEIMGTINQQRTVLEGRLEQLRTFEREYRTRSEDLPGVAARGTGTARLGRTRGLRRQQRGRVQSVQPGQQLVTCTSDSHQRGRPMLIVALVLAVIGLAALVTAVVTSNELIAWVCIVASVIGVLLLIVDALRDRSKRDDGDVSDGDVVDETEDVYDEDYPDEAPVAADYDDEAPVEDSRPTTRPLRSHDARTSHGRTEHGSATPPRATHRAECPAAQRFSMNRPRR